MSFLGRARKFLQDLGGEPASKAQYFNVACAWGHRVRGERTEGYQALRCPACGEGVFVLPRSPLPEVPAPSGTASPRGSLGRPSSPWVDEGPVELTEPARGTIELDEGGDVAEVEWDEATAQVAPRPAAAARPGVAPEDLAAAEIDAARGREAPTAGARARRPAEGVADPGADRRTGRRGRSRPVPVPGPALVEPRARARRGPRVGLIFLLLAVAVASAFGFRAWRQHRAQLPLVVERGRTEGIPALESGDFDRAHQLLSAARAAVDTLGGAVEDAEEIRQAADEAALFNNIGPALEDLLAEAGRTDPELWESRFETLYKGRAYLFDTFVTAVPSTPKEEGGTGRYELAYVVLPPGEASRFGDGGLALPDRYARVDLADFALFEQAGIAKDAHVTFGARLRSIAYDSESKQWVIRLESEGATFITHHEALQALGFPAPVTVELPKEDRP